MILGILAHSGAGKDTMADHLTKHHGFTKIAFADPMKRFCKELFQFTDEQMWGPSQFRNAPDKRYSKDFGFVCKTCMESLHPDGDVEEKTLRPIFDSKCFYCSKMTLAQDLRQIQVYLTPRYALQKLGTEWGRDCYQDIWAEHAMTVAKRIENGTSYSATNGLGIQQDIYRVDKRGVIITDCRFKNEMKVIKREGGKVIRLRRAGKDGAIAGGISGHASEEEQKSIPDYEFDFVLDVPEGLENYYKAIDEMMEKLR